ncbi:helix-hairpin-helix domain-containing protein [Halolamina rubra]|uniref:helix-hairpin-helix domain-containing protein n=1 Tax=Halolamina rubra TaxID=1380430 RepID=UPI000678477B|nr:helix-hairpin-helix domain-containing protein [Halolamina rubra]
MAADSADAVDTPDRYERLAELVDAIESEGTQVTDTDTRILHDDTLRATIEVEIDEGRLESAHRPTLRGARPPTVSIEMQGAEKALEDTDMDAEEIVDELEEEAPEAPRELLSVSGVGERKARLLAGHGYKTIEDLEAAKQSDLTEVSRVGPALAARIKADVGGADVFDHLGDGEQHECRFADESEDQNTDETNDSAVGEREVEPDVDDETVDAVEDATDDEDEQDDQAAAGESAADPLAKEIISILEAEGELRSSDLRDRVDGNQTEFYAACDDLKEATRLTVRDDPDDGRRKLYSLADDQDDGPEWNGRDPESIVADSSLPARVVLEDILNAVADASTVIEAAETLDVDVDNLEPVCWHLTLKQPDSLEIVGDIEDRIKTVQEVADVE